MDLNKIKSLTVALCIMVFISGVGAGAFIQALMHNLEYNPTAASVSGLGILLLLMLLIRALQNALKEV
jgi:hypothetical protein